MNRTKHLLVAMVLFILIFAPLPKAVAAEKNVETIKVPVSVTVPSSVSDGTAFLCSVAGVDLRSITVSFLNRSLTVSAPENHAATPGSATEIRLLLPVPLDHESMTVNIAWTANFTNGPPLKGATPVRIIAKKYPVQKLTLAPKYVTPAPELKDRIAKERALLGTALSLRSGARHWNLPMIRPVPGKTTSWYGLRRVLNGQPRSPHKGLDFRAASGDPIAAIADGTVALTGDFYYPGKFVVVDHGLGVVSISMHMSEVIAQNGQNVKSGEVIGLVGSTGRSTGPHLHLGLSVLGQSIDAFPLLDLTAEDKTAYENALKSSANIPAKSKGTLRVKSKSGPIKKGTSAKGGVTPGAKTSNNAKSPARKTP